MLLFSMILACSEPSEEDTQESSLTCVAWEDSCGGCTWMCTDERLKPDVVCDIECTEPVPEGECQLLDDNTCGFQ